MKYLIATMLLALAPLSWGEDVWYCIVTESQWIVEDNGEPHSFPPAKKLDTMTVKYDEGAGEILVMSKEFSGDGVPFRFACTDCRHVGDKPELIGILQTTRQLDTFALSGNQFYQSGITGGQAYAEAGTCTKF